MREMKQVFMDELAALMRKDPRIVIVDGDVGRASGTLFMKNEFPDRYFDVGIAEQNMAGVAAGLSAYGFVPVISSFTPFVTRRICDQVAISVSYARLSAKIFGCDPGITAAFNGGTHMSVEDVGVMRSIPGMVIFEPVDEEQFKQALPAIFAYEGPVYTRMFRKKAEPVFDENYKFDLFTSDLVREGKDITIVASGILVQEAVKAHEALLAKGISCEIINAHTIKPLDAKPILESANKTRRVLVCENHNVIGGLYSAVSEALFGQGSFKVARLGIEDRFGQVGNLEELKKHFGFTAEKIIDKAEAMLH